MDLSSPFTWQLSVFRNLISFCKISRNSKDLHRSSLQKSLSQKLINEKFKNLRDLTESTDLVLLYQTRVGVLSGPGPCSSKRNMREWGAGGGLSLGSPPPDSYLSGGRDSEGIQATRSRAVSLHSRHTAAGSGCQQSEHVAF